MDDEEPKPRCRQEWGAHQVGHDPRRLSWRQLALSLLGLTFLWPAVMNRSPFLFADTPSYIRAVDATMLRATGHATAWSNRDVREVVTEAQRHVKHPAIAGTDLPDRTTIKPILLGRSIFYGVLAYLGPLVGSFWPVVIVQALIVQAVIIGMMRHIINPSEERHFGQAVAVSTLAVALSPLPYFASMIMPDVFAGTSVVAAAVLVTRWAHERPMARFGWFAVASYGALTHSSHVLILGALAVIALVSCRYVPSFTRAGAWAILAAAGVGMGGEMAFAIAVEKVAGTPPIRPPFITARLVADGPGMAYLASHCGQSEYLLCKYRDRLPLPSDDFLWGGGHSGVFKSIPIVEQRKLADEQGRFVRAVIVDRPWAVAGTTLSAMLRQASAWGLPEFNLQRADAASLAVVLPESDRSAFISTSAANGNMPTSAIAAMSPLWIMAGCLSLLGFLIHRNSLIAAMLSVLVAGWFLDIMACGALSTPHDRYQARIVWVMTLATVTSAIVFLRGRAVKMRRGHDFT